jgi:hypothetical protein
MRFGLRAQVMKKYIIKLPFSCSLSFYYLLQSWWEKSEKKPANICDVNEEEVKLVEIRVETLLNISLVLLLFFVPPNLYRCCVNKFSLPPFETPKFWQSMVSSCEPVAALNVRAVRKFTKVSNLNYFE